MRVRPEGRGTTARKSRLTTKLTSSAPQRPAVRKQEPFPASSVVNRVGYSGNPICGEVTEERKPKDASKRAGRWVSQEDIRQPRQPKPRELSLRRRCAWCLCPTFKVSVGRQPPLASDLSLSWTAASGSFQPVVRHFADPRSIQSPLAFPAWRCSRAASTAAGSDYERLLESRSQRDRSKPFSPEGRGSRPVSLRRVGRGPLRSRRCSW